MGPNNTGKTSVLEALKLIANPIDELQWLGLAAHRGMNTPQELVEGLSWLFPHVLLASGSSRVDPILLRYRRGGESARVEASSENLSRPAMGLPVVPLPPGSSLAYPTATSWVFSPGQPSSGVRWRVQMPPLAFSWTFEFWPESSISQKEGSRPESRLTAEFLGAYEHRNTPRAVRAFSALGEQDKYSSLREALQSFDPRVKMVALSDTSGLRSNIALSYEGRAGFAPLSTFGDGLRRVFFLALCLLSAEGGMLLIDELEVALHPGRHGDVFRWLFKQCLERNVQIWATTHSLEAIDGVLEVADALESHNLTAYHLRRKEDATLVQTYDLPTLKRLRQERGLDIR